MTLCWIDELDYFNSDGGVFSEGPEYNTEQIEALPGGAVNTSQELTPDLRNSGSEAMKNLSSDGMPEQSHPSLTDCVETGEAIEEISNPNIRNQAYRLFAKYLGIPAEQLKHISALWDNFKGVR